ncbi:TrkH family potassium uptake protein [Bacteroidota bacterium]
MRLNLSKINFKIILRILGVLLIIEGLFMFTALPFSYYYGSKNILQFNLFDGVNDFWALLISGLFTSLVGLIILYNTKDQVLRQIGKREGYIIVTFAWLINTFFGTLPFLLSGCISSYTDAFFETMSGFTTTGASILTDIESFPKGILFWRSMTHWIGGMGIIVLSLAILPFLGIGGMQLFAAEVPGPTPDKLHPRITDTAKRLWGIYVLLTIAETILLMAGGLNLFDSLCHAFGTMATGGFSTKNASIAEFSSYSQYIIIVFMFLAGMNFSLHYLSLKGKFSRIRKNDEFRFYFLIIAVSSILITLSIIIIQQTPFEPTFRAALFQIVSIVTTTGYVTENYMQWPFFAILIVFILMFTGGCAGSTGGGIKMMRQYLLYKNSKMELRRLIHPQAIIPVKFNGKVVPQSIVFNVLTFFVIYVFIFVIGSIIMSFLGLDFETSVGSVAATLGNIGPGIGNVGPIENYANLPVFGKWFLSFLMLLGRLELFTILILLSPSFWRK